MPTNPFGSFEDSFEQGVSQVKQQVTQQVVGTPAKTSSQQASLTPVSDSAHTITTDSAVSTQPDGSQIQQDPLNETGNSSQSQNQMQQDAAAKQATAQLEENDKQDKEQKLVLARKRLAQLHKQVYYDPTFNRRKPEQSVSEKLEQEKEQEEQKKMTEIQEQKKKDEPIALNRAKRTAEMNRGASG